MLVESEEGDEDRASRFPRGMVGTQLDQLRKSLKFASNDS